MKPKHDFQRVDIDTYFSDMDDLAIAASEAIPPATQPPDSRAEPLFKQLLVTDPDESASVLKPYVNQRSLLASDRDFTAAELSTAHQTMRQLRQQIQALDTPAPAPILSADNPPPGHTRRWRRGLEAVCITGAIALVSYLSWPAVTTCVTTACHRQRVDQWLATVQAINWAALDLPTLPWPVQPGLTLTAAPEPSALGQGIHAGYTAATLTQTATSSADWHEVVTLWQVALDHLNAVAPDSPDAAEAQAKKAFYQSNLSYARQEMDMAPFRTAVLTAETASELAIQAKTPAEWQYAARTWQSALTMMQQVSTSSAHYALAQTKLVEYSTKFAYAQQRYLASQSGQSARPDSSAQSTREGSSDRSKLANYSRN